MQIFLGTGGRIQDFHLLLCVLYSCFSSSLFSLWFGEVFFLGPDTTWKESVLPPCSAIAGGLRRPGEVSLSPTRVFTSRARAQNFIINQRTYYSFEKDQKSNSILKNINYRFWMSCALDHSIFLLCHTFPV